MPSPTITAIRTRAVLAPLPRPITTAVAAIEKAPLLLIDIETREGVVGRSYLFTYTPLALAPLSSLIRNVGDSLIGKTVDPLPRFAELTGMFRLLGRQGLVAMAMAGFDMAFWDALGKSCNRSVAEMLGAAPMPLPCYDSHGIFDGQRDRALLEQSLQEGFRAVKFKIGNGTDGDDIRALTEITEIAGPEVDVMVDYNQSLRTPEAVRRIRALEDRFDLAWIEEPLPAEDYAGYQTLRSAVRTPLQAGENWWLPEDAARAIGARVSDHAMLDIMKIGGVTGWMRAAPLADAASMPVSSHIFVEASAHVLAATPNRHLLEYLDVAGGILAAPYEITRGTLTAKGPGLGIAWDEKAVTRHAA
ncbi:enolase C-terminal domain-like protein [Dinoroseobacter sp. S375]|uniref:enolase C-terminal domain-like protein n=1 Tax=Dinoroseobacter sp. S375 TaxID=3415136 RepID=UPI003C7B8C3B